MDIYSERVQLQQPNDGTATLYTQKAKEGTIIEVFVLAASGNLGSAGEWTTVGKETAGVLSPLDSKICLSVNSTCILPTRMFYRGGERAYAHWEAANAAENLVLVVNGLMFTEEEFQRRHGETNHVSSK